MDEISVSSIRKTVVNFRRSAILLIRRHFQAAIPEPEGGGWLPFGNRHSNANKDLSCAREDAGVAFTLDTKRRQRFEFMRCLYDKTEGSEMGLVYVEEIADQIKLPLPETEIIALFLADEGLLRVRMRNIISITHIGIDEVETALGQPDKPTVHFPPLNSAAEHVLSAPPPMPSHHVETPDFARQLHAEPELPFNLPLQ